MNVSGTTVSATGHKGGLGDGLYDKAGARPDLDLDFARTKSLKDRISKEDLITFKRETGGLGNGSTYVDENGLVKKAPVNLIHNSHNISQEVTNTDIHKWRRYLAQGIGTGQGPTLTIEANYAIAPDGTKTAARCEFGSGTKNENICLLEQRVSNTANPIVPANTPVVLSVYLKSTSGSSQTINFSNTGSHRQILTVTGEWQRFELKSDKDTADCRLRVGIRTGDESGTFLNQPNSNGDYDNIQRDILVWGAQVEYTDSTESNGLVTGLATELIKTGSYASGAPRFTHDPYTLESKGLLIEKATTNFVTSSEDIMPIRSQGGWGNNKANKISNQTTAPDGTLTADEIEWNGAGNNPLIFQPRPGNGVYTISAFFKKGNTDGAHIYADNSSFKAALFDLENGTTLSKHSTFSSSSIEDYGNGWFRCSATTTAISGANFGYGPCEKEETSNTNIVPSTSDASVYVWGMQIENGSRLTSYIPTPATSSVTRSPDLVKIEGDNFGTYRTNLVTNTSFRKEADGWIQSHYSGIQTAKLETYAAASPFGTYDAGKATAIGSNSAQHQIRKLLTLETSVKYSASVYVKAGNWKIGRLGISWNDGTTQTETNNPNTFNVVSFNLNEGYVDSNGRPNQGFTSAGVTSSSVTPVGNGWFKVQLVSETTASTIQSANVAVSFLDSNGTANFTANNEDFFIWGLQVVKADTNSEFIPSTDEYTNRQTNATFVDGNGIIKTSYANHFLHSEDFSSWVHVAGNTTVDSNFAIAPDGTQTADKITISDQPESSTLIRQTVAFVGGETYTFSAWIKSSGSGSKFDMYSTASNPDMQLSTNLGIATTVGVTAPDEWTRYSITFTAAATGNFTIGFNNGPNGPDDWVSEFLVWGAQLVKGSDQPENYYKTTDTISGPPRYSHDPETLTPTGLYLEPQSTNYLENSSNFNHAYSTGGWAYATSNDPRISYDYNIANPDGYMGAAYLNNNGSETYTNFDTTQYDADDDGSPDGTDTITISCFVKAKANESNPFIIQLYSTQSNTLNISLGWLLQFDPTANNGEGNLVVFNPTRNNVVIGAATNPIKEKYPNGWFRVGCTVKIDPVTIDGVTYSQFANNARFDIQGAANNNDGADGKHYFWGPQVEVGKNLTSYIPTSGGQGTRNPDIFTSTATEVLDRANGTKPAFYTKSGLTVFSQFDSSKVVNSRIFEFGADTNMHASATMSSGNKLGVYQPNDAAAHLTAPSTPLIDGENKLALRYEANNLKLFTNGNDGPTDISVATKESTKLTLGDWSQVSTPTSHRSIRGTIKRLTIWKTPFVNSKLEKITQIIT